MERNVFDWNGVLANAVWAAIGGTGVYLWRFLDKWRKTRGQRALLAGLGGPTLFVFPPRPGSGRLLPQTAIEDFLAINNIISAYLRIGEPAPDRMRDHNHLTEAEKKQNNLILICSSSSNKVTKEALSRLRARSPILHDLIPTFEDVPGAKDQIQIKWNKGVFPSETFSQQMVDGARLDDLAIIVKAQNPWAGQYKVLIVAGIRGIGTWGAAEMLKKWWEPIYDAKDHSRRRNTTKQGDFVAIVSVHYEDHDIKNVVLRHLADLDQHYLPQP